MSQIIAPSSAARGVGAFDPTIVVVQKNNIGDLVLITPMLAELRRRLPTARIDVLVNSYNCAVLDGNPDVDQVIVHVKRKHQLARVATWRHYGHVLRLMSELRRTRYDYAFLLNGRFSGRCLLYGQLIAPRQIVGFVDHAASKSAKAIDIAIASDSIPDRHVVPRSFWLLNAAFPDAACTSISPESNPCRVYPDVTLRSQLLSELHAAGMPLDRPIVALQISARRAKQRWPAERFAMLARQVAAKLQASPVFFWAPGLATEATHPGDDDLARQVLHLCGDFPAFACRTATLAQLFAGLSLANVVVSSDGGAMHVAAACGRPLVALFGDSDPRIWHPWCQSYRLVQSRSGDVSDIPAEEVFTRLEELSADELLVPA